MATQQWLTEWAAAQVYESNEQMSRACFKELLPAFPGHQVHFGPTADQAAYVIEVVGAVTASVSVTKSI